MTVDELFQQTPAQLVELWRQAKVAEIRASAVKLDAKGTDDAGEAQLALAEAKLEADTIRLVISFRLTGRNSVEIGGADG